jgi:N-acylneuraminate cytidylyltransferase
MVIISTEANPVVAARGAKLKLDVLQGIEDKLPTFEKWAAGHGLTIDQVAFVGNDINDLECLHGAGLGVVVSDAYPVATDAADLVLTRDGGRGAVREIADLWLAAHTD